MKVIVIGCGRMGSELAYRLFKRGHDVAVIDRKDAAFNHLPSDFEGRLYEGEGLNQDVVERAGIKNCDAVAVVTENDFGQHCGCPHGTHRLRCKKCRYPEF